ncbi:MAG: hypothetical protein ACXAAO_05110 [Candidatus Thorarchaeota archaeon]|jgi:hypothetical protein
MSWYEGVQEESTTTSIARWMNTIRIPLYLCVTWIQLNLLSVTIAAGDPYDIGTVIVPLGLAALDVIMVLWSRERKRGTGTAGLILSSLSLGVVINSLQSYLLIFLTRYTHLLIIEDYFMIVLGILVGLVSLVELSALLYGSLHTPKETLDSAYTVRTYET